MSGAKSADILTVEFFSQINQIDASEWNALNANNYPFSQYEFLASLESSKCVGGNSGWQPCHIVVKRKDKLIAVMPSYLKDHSYGEYVFDWSWAQAYQQHGLDYYPKLISAIPFTPVPGNRLLCEKTENPTEIIETISKVIRHRAEQDSWSGWHLLFPESNLRTACSKLDLLQREDVQFHWCNNNYQNFEDFLATLRSTKRKQIRRERRKVAEQNVSMHRYTGSDISAEILQSFYICYCQTYLRRSGHSGYLNQKFFEQVISLLGEQTMICLAMRENQAIAASLFFFDDLNLYGRYWGCIEDIDCLHFEACYYQGMEFAIEKNLMTFNPGTQGEHKLVRGFEPTKTYSLHWIKDASFRSAIADFIEHESDYKTQYQEAARDALPFRKNAR